MARTETILTSTEMSELQDLVDGLIRHDDNPILPGKSRIYYEGGNIDNVTRIAEILGLEVSDDT